MLESFAGWLTPTSLFLLLNIVIGTIWVTSILSNKHHHHHPSVNRVKYNPNRSDGYGDDQYFPPAEHVYAAITAQKTTSSLARAPSILDRVRSVNFNDFQFSFFGSEIHGHVSELNPETPQFHGHVRELTSERPLLARALERVRSINFADLNLHNFSGFRSEPSIPAPEIPDLDPKKPPPRALLERVKSISFTDLNNFSVFRSETHVAEPPPEIEISGPDPDRRRERRGGSAAADRRKEKMRKSTSEKKDLRERSAAAAEEEVERRRPATARVERTVSIGGDVEVDAKADDFINRFKQQLKLQRLDSILQYKEMISRGASK